MGFYDSVTANAAMSIFQSDTVVITRSTPSTTPGTFNVTTIYSGACDFQEGSGSQYVLPGGTVDQADAVMFIDSIKGVLPSLQAGDKATVNGKDFNVIIAPTWSLNPPHVEVQLKRGPIPYRGQV